MILAIVLPVAALLGFMLAKPDSMTSMMFLALIIGVLLIPIFLRWHHPLVILAWSAPVSVFFLPGQPSLWMLMAGISLFCAVMARVMDRQSTFLNVSPVSCSLIALSLVVLLTMKMTGGIGLRSLGGDSFGGKKFVFLLAAVIGYFAISSQRIPLEKARKYLAMFTLPGLLAAMSNLIWYAGPTFFFLYYIFPVDLAVSQAIEDIYGTLLGVRFNRLTGVTFAGLAAFAYMMMRFGLTGTFDFRKPWRAALLLLIIGFSSLGGFRSALVIYALTIVAQFHFERLYRTRAVLAIGVAAVVGGAALIPLAPKLPPNIQRSLSFLPGLQIDPAVRADAQASIDWRVEMWRALLPEIKGYLWIGKGYRINPTDLYLLEESSRRGLLHSSEGAMIAGDYHNGPLSVLIPFGLLGSLAFVAFLISGGWTLHRNYQYGDPALKTINTGLLSAFVAKTMFYLLVCGSLHSDLPTFTGLVAFGVALNGGVAKPECIPPEPSA
jgi:hypothetical protein